MYTDEDHYLLGDTVRGTIYFSEDFKNADLTVTLVFSNESTYYRDNIEHEYEAAHAHDVCFRGSSFPFSCRIPETGYPTLRTPHVRIWWTLRAVVERPFRFAKICEKEITVDPLVF